MRLPFSRSMLFGLAMLLGLGLLLSSACSSGGSRGKSSPPSTAPVLGQVSVLSASTCPRGPGSLPNTSCMQLMIDGLGVPAIEVELRITEPDAGSTLRGTVLMGTGLLGSSFYADEAGGNQLIPSLSAAGFRVVDRAWNSGWFASGSSIRPQSGRYATLVTWVQENLHLGGSFCVTGNSGGSAEIAYALSSWQRADIIDVALLTSGPPMSRLDYLCENPASAEWANICASIVPTGALACGVSECTAVPGNILCSLLPMAPQLGELEADSIMHPGASMDYPNTFVHGLFGAQDCSSAVPLGLFYLNAISSQKAIDFVTGTPHLVPSSADGRGAILQALMDATGPPATPVAITQTHTTQQGERQIIEVQTTGGR